MILHTDIPTRAQPDRLLAARDPWSVSIYLSTSPSSRGEAERIELKNLAGEASRQLQQAGAPRGDVAATTTSSPTSSTTTSSGATRREASRSS